MSVPTQQQQNQFPGWDSSESLPALRTRQHRNFADIMQIDTASVDMLIADLDESNPDILANAATWTELLIEESSDPNNEAPFCVNELTTYLGSLISSRYNDGSKASVFIEYLRADELTTFSHWDTLQSGAKRSIRAWNTDLSIPDISNIIAHALTSSGTDLSSTPRDEQSHTSDADNSIDDRRGVVSDLTWARLCGQLV